MKPVYIIQHIKTRVDSYGNERTYTERAERVSKEEWDATECSISWVVGKWNYKQKTEGGV